MRRSNAVDSRNVTSLRIAFQLAPGLIAKLVITKAKPISSWTTTHQCALQKRKWRNAWKRRNEEVKIATELRSITGNGFNHSGHYIISLWIVCVLFSPGILMAWKRVLDTSLNRIHNSCNLRRHSLLLIISFCVTVIYVRLKWFYSCWFRYCHSVIVVAFILTVRFHF